MRQGVGSDTFPSSACWVARLEFVQRDVTPQQKDVVMTSMDPVGGHEDALTASSISEALVSSEDVLAEIDDLSEYVFRH